MAQIIYTIGNKAFLAEDADVLNAYEKANAQAEASLPEAADVYWDKDAPKSYPYKVYLNGDFVASGHYYLAEGAMYSHYGDAVDYFPHWLATVDDLAEA